VSGPIIIRFSQKCPANASCQALVYVRQRALEVVDRQADSAAYKSYWANPPVSLEEGQNTSQIAQWTPATFSFNVWPCLRSMV